MEKPIDVYRKNINRFEGELKQVKKQLLGSSMVRLGVFVLLVFGVYWFWGQVLSIIVTIFIGIGVFLFLVSRHTDLSRQKHRLEALIAINKKEITVLQGNFHHLPTGSEFNNPNHAFSQDIDLFGKGSFFQYLNRTSLQESKGKLAELLLSNSIKDIKTRQDTIKDLTQKVDFRQEFSAQAILTSREEEPQTSIPKRIKALQEHSFFVPKYAVALSWVFSVISLGLIFALSMDLISYYVVLIWLFIGLGVSGIYGKRVNPLSEKVSKMQATFRQYHKLLLLLEETDFSSEFMQNQKNRIATTSKKASQIIKEFSKAIDALDQRNNLIFGFIGNGFLLWDLRQSAKLEKWIKAYSGELDDWFEVIAETDALNSLGNFAFNHPNYLYPLLRSEGKYRIQAKNAVHPLIPEKEAITNDFKIEQKTFFIITGANMAGKSTFLRTVALQIMMSNVGLPVRASQVEYMPIKLITSMRTVDSLAEESSYFYAELSRLKFIIDKLKEDRYFIILDEILKGTNSTDKAIGSQKFLQKLVKSKAIGLIATHDLSLCEVAEEMDRVENYYFDAQIIDDELYFDYKFKPGICQNMNASFLLKKMEIVDE